MLRACHENELTPMVTLHHFTSPRWLMKYGGWTGKETPELFANYCKFVIEQLGEHIPYVCTLNEVNLPDLLVYIMRSRTPDLSQAPVGIQANHDLTWLQKAALAYGLDVNTDIHPFPFTFVKEGNFVQTILGAHQKARAAIKKINPTIKVGFSLALHEIQTQPGGETIADEMWHTLFKQYLPTLRGDDFFALQNYTREVIGPEGTIHDPNAKRTQMGYEYCPEALAGVTRAVAKDLNIPIIITENGVATSDDKERIEFIERALTGLSACIQDGINIQGYYYWSAFDNYEWVMGYRMTFGLIEANRTTQERKVKESAKYLGNIAKSNV
jgi:beta-glucosidase